MNVNVPIDYAILKAADIPRAAGPTSSLALGDRSGAEEPVASFLDTDDGNDGDNGNVGKGAVGKNDTNANHVDTEVVDDGGTGNRKPDGDKVAN